MFMLYSDIERQHVLNKAYQCPVHNLARGTFWHF